MPSFEPILDHALPYGLVLVRLTGLLVFSPLISGRLVPRRFKIMLAMMFAAVIYPMTPREVGLAAGADVFTIAPLAVSELLIGSSIGLIASIPLYAADMAGTIAGHQMGLGIARVFNPEMDAESEAVANLLFYAAMAGFIALGGLDVLFLAIARTFETVPIGSFGLDEAPLNLVVGTLTSGMELALRVAAPVVVSVLMILIGMSVVAKTMPQVNILSVGFAMKILLGLVVLAWTSATIHAAQLAETESVLHQMLEWVWGRTAEGGGHG